jgi:hypothetical protein
MTTQRTRTVSGRAVGVGLATGALALGVAALAGSSAQHVTDNAQLGDSVWTNTQGVSTVGTVGIPTVDIPTVGIPSFDILPGDADGNTVVESPGPSIAVTDDPGNTIVWFPGGAIVTGSTFVF